MNTGYFDHIMVTDENKILIKAIAFQVFFWGGQNIIHI